MEKVANKQVLVLGLDLGGQAACELLCRQGAKVVAIDSDDTPDLRARSESLRQLGVEVVLGVSSPPSRSFQLAVLTSKFPLESSLVQAVRKRELPLVSEFELGFDQTNCLTIAISGTNGKSTTARLIERMFSSNHRKTLVCGSPAAPVCSVVEQSRDLDFLIVQADSFQLEATELLRPAVAVVLNLATDPRRRDAGVGDDARAVGRLFRNQQAFDWAIVQSEALVRLRESGIMIPSKTITFSAGDPAADLCLDRGLLLSRLPNWSGPLVDMDHCQLRGPHNAENLMAALSVGHVLRLPLENMVDPLKTCTAGPHRFELIAEINGVQFIDDAKACNLDALQKALVSARPGPAGEPNIWLIAGGKDSGSEFHDVGPTLSKRVKGAFLIGEAAENIRAAWSLFTPCICANSLLEAVAEAAGSAASGDVILFSPACSGLAEFRDCERQGLIFDQAVKSISRGAMNAPHNINGRMPSVP
jgi:UDP-N-acetylmuramoylalanine--D-glutamate ligase